MIKKFVSSILPSLRAPKGRSNLLVSRRLLRRLVASRRTPRNDAGKRFIASILVLLHVMLIIASEASAMSSASYRIDSVAINSGGNNNKSSPGYKIALDAMGQAAPETATSASFKLSSGFIYSVLSNPPVFTGAILNQSWKENETKDFAFDLDDYFTTESAPITYAVKKENADAKISIAIDPVTHLVSFSQPSAYYGTETVSFHAKDAEGNECWSNSVQLTVEGVDNAPVMDFINDISVNENELIQIIPHATDSDGDNITFSFTSPLDLDGKWQTDYLSAGVYAVKVIATDDSAAKLSVSQDVKITVKNVNRPPVLKTIFDITVNEGDVVVITPDATDPDFNTLTYYYAQPFDEKGKWITGYDNAGVYTVKVTVTDGIDSVSQDVKVTINNTNRPPAPVLTVSENTVSPNQSFTINLSAVDPDSDAMTYNIEIDSVLVKSGMLIGDVSLTYLFSKAGDYTIKATVTDINSSSLTASLTTVINVIDPNLNRDSIVPILGDFNADALADLGSHNIDNGAWDIAVSEEGIFNYTTTWLSNFGASKDWIPISGDFNGDAYTDIGIYNNTTGECKIALNNKNGKFTDSGQWVKFSSVNYDWAVLTADFNNDGKTDLAVYNPKTGELRVALSNGSAFGEFISKITGFSDSAGWQPMMADVNGDSLVDFVLFNKSTGEWKVALYTGSSFIDTGIWINNFAKDKQPLLADFNNDGTTDIGYWDKDKVEIKYAISTGSKFSDNGVFRNNLPADKGDFIYIADFNGDGLSDIAFFDKNKLGIECWYVILATTKPADLLTSIENGTGGKIEITYDYAAKSDNALLPFPVYVTTKIEAVDMLPVGLPQERYAQIISYTGGWFDANEREFRGFRTATVKDPITGNYTKTYFHQGSLPEDGSLKGKTEKIESFDGNAKLISKTENTWQVKLAGPVDSGIGFPYLAETKNTVNEENNISIATKDAFIYDAIGNATDSTSEGDITKTGDERKTHTDYNQPYDLGHNTPNLVQFLNASSQVVNQSSFKYDDKGNLLKQTVYIDGSDNDPKTTYTYDDFGNVLTAIDPLGRVNSTEYDSVVYAYPVKATNVLGHTISTAYDYKFGVVVSATDTNGNTSQSVYDTFARPIQQINALGDTVVTISYPDFNTKITTNAIGLVSKEYIDGLGRKYLTKAQGEDGNSLACIVSEVTYNNRGAVESESLPHYETDAQTACTRYEYDIRGRVIKVKADFIGELKDAEARTEYLSPLSGRVTDALGHKKDTIKDVWGRNIEIIERTSSGDYHTYYEYDIKDNLTKVTDVLGNVTTIQYDTLGRKTSMNDPDMGIWKYEYDKLGNLIKQTDAKNQVLTFEYDLLNRLTRKSSLRSASGGEAISSYFYDDASKANCVGRLSRVVDNSGSTEFFYDKLGREIKSTKTIDSASYAIQREYDISGRLTKLIYPDGEQVLYLYDTNSGLLESVVGNSSYVSNINYNAKGQMLNINYGNGTQTIYAYGQDLRLSYLVTSLRAPAGGEAISYFQNLYYDFDKNGNLTVLTDNVTSKTRTYEYDDLDRLTWSRNIPTADGFGATQNFQYDAIGNMTYKSDVGQMIHGVSAGPHAVTTAGAYTYQYDANGNMISGRNKTLEYDPENRLIKVSELGTITTFNYDGDGGRVKKSSPSGTTTYVGSLFEINSDGTTTKHIFAGANRIASISSLRGVPKLRDDEAISYYHTDHLGSSNVITDANGNQIQHCEYAPYGSLTLNSVFASPEGAKQSPISHYFTGKELDNTGLYFYAWRYYDPHLGRFTQPDTIVPNPTNPQDFNRYSYCNNNPINYVDPSGHSWFSKNWRTIVGVVGTVVSMFCPVLSPAMWAINTAISAYTAIDTGSIAAFAGGMIGGIIGGGLGQGVGKAFAGALGANSFTFLGGAVIGAGEFGVSGFASGFGGALASGASFKDSMRAGGMGAAIGAVTGAIIEGSYLAGWQHGMHGLSGSAIGPDTGVEREVGLHRGYSDITPLGKNLHEGIEITDNWRDLSGRWEFDALDSQFFRDRARAGQFTLGAWKTRITPFQSMGPSITNSLSSVTAVYGDIQSQLGKIKIYHASGIPNNCRTEAERVIFRALRVENK